MNKKYKCIFVIILFLFTFTGCETSRLDSETFIEGIALPSPNGYKCAYVLTFTGGATGGDITILTISPPNVINLKKYEWQHFEGYLYEWENENILHTIEINPQRIDEGELHQYNLGNTKIIRNFDTSHKKYLLNGTLLVIGSFSSFDLEDNIVKINMKYESMSYESVLRFRQNIAILDSLKKLTVGLSGSFTFFVDGDSVLIERTGEEVTNFSFKRRIKTKPTKDRILEIPMQNLTVHTNENGNISKLEALIKEGYKNEVNSYMLTASDSISAKIIANKSLKIKIDKNKFRKLSEKINK